MRLDLAEVDRVVARAEADLRSLAGARLLLTGGTGFFGAWLVETLARADERFGLGARVIVVSRDPAAAVARVPRLAESRAIELLAGDARTLEAPRGEVTHVLHAAASSGTPLDDANALEMLDTVVLGTRRVLEIAAEKDARRVLYVSSGAVYGPQPPGVERIDEQMSGGPDPLAPASAYAESKRLAEQLVALFARTRSVPATIARAFAFVGPGLPLDAHFAAGNFVRDGLAGGPIVVAGDGTAVRSYQWAGDLVVWLLAALARGVAGRAYNVGDERAVSIGDLAALAGEVFGVPVEVRGRPDPSRAIDRYVPSTARARAELGVSNEVGLREALEKTARHHGFVRRA